MLKLSLLLFVLILSACEQKTPELPPLEEPTPIVDDSGLNTYQLNSELLKRGQAATTEALDAANALDLAIVQLLNEPTEANLIAARLQWQLSIDAFYKAQPYFMVGVDASGGENNSSVAHWPFYPGFIDSYGPYRDSGVINAIDSPLTLNTVQRYHQQYDDSELLLGFYPIAYLLWSEYQPRPAEDFVALMDIPAAMTDEDIKITQLPQNRRRQMLRLQSEWLLMELKTFSQRWANFAANESLLPTARIRSITDSLLLSLESMLQQIDEGTSLPRQFIRQHQGGVKSQIANIPAYYLDSGLAEYWLLAEEQIQVQQLLAELQASEEGITGESLQTLINWIRPDSAQATNTDAPLNQNIEATPTQ